MGAIPVLLKLVVVMGITYGWQPDQNGGVEYIVQVSPDELARVEQLGDLKTEIDPTVRGHVSRIIVRVGNDKLPRQTPAHLASGDRTSKSITSGVRLAISDYTTVGAPEISQTSGARVIAAKPQNDGPGFKLPSLPPSLGDAASNAAQGVRKEFDQAGRELAQRGSNQLNTAVSNALRNAKQAAGQQGSGLLPPPGTRVPNAKQAAPQFTGSDPNGTFARARAGGPSTEPINTRDRSWNELAGARSGGPSTEPLTTSRQGNSSQLSQVNQTAGQSSRRGVNGLAPNDTFGKMPGGMSLPNTNPNFNTASANQQAPRGSILSQYEQTLLDRQNQLASDTRNQDAAKRAELLARQNAAAQPTGPDPRLTAAEIAAGGYTIDEAGRALDRYGRLLPKVPSANTQMSSQANSSFARLNAPSQSQPSQNAGPFSTNTNPASQSQPAQSQSPFWQGQQTRNPFGQEPVARSQQPPMNSTDSSIQYQRDLTQSRLGQTANQQNQFGLPMNQLPMTQTPLSQTQLVQTQTRQPQSQLPQAQQPSYPPTAQPSIYRTDLSRSPRPPLEQDPPSLSNRNTTSGTIGSSRSEPKQVAAQPLFNGLLLLSFVANIYLMFWLKNLRLQFRDLVAAKRMANANTSPV